MHNDDHDNNSVVPIVVLIIVGIIAITAFALWWRRDTIFPQSNEDGEPIITSSINKDYLDNTLNQLFIYNDMEVSSEELQDITTEDDSGQLVNELIPVVNNNSSTTKVVVPILDQNLLFVPAPSAVMIVMNGQIIPMLFIKADEATVTAYNPITSNVVDYPFTTFSKSYDEAGRQCIFITDRGYTGY